MCLAVMLAEGRDELVCDFAETYHVLDLWALPVPLMATLAAGLRDNSRVKMKMAGLMYIPPEVLLPRVTDVLTAIAVGLSKNAKMPPLMMDVMTGKAKPKEEKTEPVMSFDSTEDFDAMWAQLTHKE